MTHRIIRGHHFLCLDAFGARKYRILIIAAKCRRLEISTQTVENSLAGSHLLNRVQPYPAAGVTRHAQVTPWGDGNRADLRSVREAGTFELLAEETAVEYLKPFKDYSVIIDIFKRNFCDSVYLIGSKSKT